MKEGYSKTVVTVTQPLHTYIMNLLLVFPGWLLVRVDSLWTGPRS